MADYLPALRDYLISDASISGVIGERIFPLFAPQGVGLPLLIWVVNGANRNPRHNGGMVQSFLDLEIHVDAQRGYGNARDLANRIRLRLDEFKGEMSDRDFDIRGIILDDQDEQYMPPTDGSGAGVIVMAMEFTVWYRETPARPCG